MKLPKKMQQNKYTEELANTLIKKDESVVWLPSLPQECFRQNKEKGKWETDGFKYWFYQPQSGLPPFEVKCPAERKEPTDITEVVFNKLTAVRINDDVYFKCTDFNILEGGK
ncbi:MULTISPECIES: hypothetical protein [Streptococcus anginosus group]|uniref:hypothetical protein n=1 Tax=Streptococcus anginosus group TaxID=671232 RepID=UPI000C8273E7|nr:hypothetical protein [Streptococcus intermedius]PMR65699.1 hypothetical protein C1I62_05945 [Streptococcus intermedius]